MSAASEHATVGTAAKFFDGYRASPDVYDEASPVPTSPRPHWERFVTLFDRLGRDELALRRESARRIIREHGVTYNVYGDPEGMDRPWQLDLVPLLMPPEEWRSIAAGLSQRTKLFNLILTDLYGQQRLLREGLLPPALVFANPGFLRCCHGIRIPQETYIHLHAVDLARSADGQWWVLADRTQAPSGAGYALENRIVLSRVLSEEFRECQVQRLTSFFNMERDALRDLAQTGGDNPNVVLLTPGPHNETYFEHAFLARHLGFTLVEGGDLTVRDQRVFIKTLAGLEPVDVIVRRVDDTFCDPLELRGDSFLGVPGMVEAARKGNVTIANALGSGLIESPAFVAFLPGLCRHLLGEELKLPSVATWWCGQGREHRYVVEHLDDIVVKPAFGTMSGKPLFGDQLDAEQRAELVAAIAARPYDFVGQEQVALSRAPVLTDNRLEPRPVVLRAYVAAGGESYAVMPGALARVSASDGDPVVSMQSGGGSKDTWVLSDEPEDTTVPWSPSGETAPARRDAAELPSRVADNLFWLGRYVERLEDTVRLLRCAIARAADEAASDVSPELTALARVFVTLNLVPVSFRGRVRVMDFEKELLLLIYSGKRTGSVRQLSTRIRHISSVVHERFSSDTWRILTQLQLDSRSRPGPVLLANALSLLNMLIVDLGAFSGMEMENMTRGQGWRFLDLGRRLERGTNLVGLLRAGLGGEVETSAVLEPLLETTDSVMTYRRRYFAQPQLAAVLELLLADETNPRSLAFQLEALTAHVAHLPREVNGSFAEKGRGRITGLFARLGGLHAVCKAHERGAIEPFDHWLSGFADELSGLSGDVTRHYFDHTVPRVS